MESNSAFNLVIGKNWERCAKRRGGPGKRGTMLVLCDGLNRGEESAERVRRPIFFKAQRNQLMPQEEGLQVGLRDQKGLSTKRNTLREGEPYLTTTKATR